MKQSSLFGLLWFLVLITGVATSKEKTASISSAQKDGSLVCQLHLVVVTCERSANDTDCQDEVECSPQMDDHSWSALSYPFHGVSKDFFRPFLFSISQGTLQAVVPGGFVARRVIVVPHGAQLQLVTTAPKPVKHGRKLTNAVGVHNVLAIRISTPDSQPTISASQLFDRLFSKSITPTLATQYAACSTGALQMQQRLRGTGVVDILLSQTIDAYTSTNAMVVEATNLFTAQFNLDGSAKAVTDFANHILFVLPPNSYVTTPWIANAVVGGWRVVCNDIYCGFISIFMHEIGHNLGLLHSNHNGAYNDRTGYMGSGVGVDYYPRECFNAAHHWNLNWYSDRHLHIDPSKGPVKFNLAAFVDYNKTTTENPVVVQIGNSHYLQYNWAADYNSDTPMYPNMVVYLHDLLTSTELLTALAFDGINQLFVETNFENTGNDLVLEVCGTNDGASTPATIMVGVGFRSQVSACTQGQLVGVNGPILGTTPTAPGPSPTSSPSPRPVNTHNCVDSPSETFPLRSSLPSGFTRNRNCAWLRSRPRQQRFHCASNQLAQSVCAKTCGRCESGSLSCQDDSTIKFNVSGTNRSCRWVSKHSHRLCQQRKDVRNSCLKTCQQCPLPSLANVGGVEASEMITAVSPNMSITIEDVIKNSTLVCKDSVDPTFPDASVGWSRSCIWLAKRPYLTRHYCANYALVRSSCPVTCNLC